VLSAIHPDTYENYDSTVIEKFKNFGYENAMLLPS